MARRYYSSTAARTTLASGVDDTTNTFTVNAVSGWPTSTPYTLIIDQDTVNEEIVEVTGRTGTTITVTRGVDGTSAVAHSSGAAVNHGVSARDFDEPNAFINGTGTVTETMLASNAVTSAKILDGTIVNADINASAAIAQSKIADLTSDLASKLPYSYGTATPSTSVDGFLWYDENDTPPTPKFWDGAAFQALGGAGGGKILQVVRATDGTDRTTTSASFVDVTGMSVTITPQKSDSAVIIVSSFVCSTTRSSSNNYSTYQIADASNNAISGAEGGQFGNTVGSTNPQIYATLFAYATPATTSATTYKLRFRANTSTTNTCLNSTQTGQMYAIEVAA